MLLSSLTLIIISLSLLATIKDQRNNNTKKGEIHTNSKITMEACFLTSKSFTKTIEFVPSINPRILTSTKTYSTHFRTSKPRLPSSITCCHAESSSSPRNEENQVATDWRSFRARLVAGERASRPAEPSLLVDPDTVVDFPQHITIGDKWAHKIHEPEKGCILVATEKLDGVHIFERTVILLLSVGPPTGIILNRPSLMSIKEMRSAVLDVAGTTFSDRPLFFGGPLEEGMFLVSPKGEENGVEKSGVFEEVMMGLYYGKKGSVGCAAEMVKRNMVGVEEFRFYDGYCGWEEEDLLRDEIRAGYWTVAACSPSVVGLSNDGNVGLWEEILGLMGPKKVW